jgi:glycosyltransferase 2 family protein
VLLKSALGPARRVATNRWAQIIAGTIASVGLAYAAFNAIAWRDVLDTFAHFPIAYALASLVPLIAAMLLRAARWSVLLHGERVSFKQVFITQNAGIGLNNMLPVRVGSEAMQLGLITRRYNVPLPRALASLVGGNVLDIFATGILMTVGVLLIPDLRDSKISIQLFGAVVMITVSLLVMLGVSRGMGAIPIANRFGFFHRVIGALRDLRNEPGRLVLSFGATFAHWFLMGVAGWILAQGLELDIDALTMASVLVAATFFTSAMLSLPGGAGTYHFALVSMLVTLGADRELAFSFAFVMHLLVFLPPMLIALLVITRLGSGALLGHRATADEPTPRPAVGLDEQPSS